MNKKELYSLKPGARVKISKKYRNWLCKNAAMLCSVGGTISSLDPYTVFILLGNDAKYKAIIKEIRHDVGDGPGARINVEFKHGLQDSFYVDRRSLKRA